MNQAEPVVERLREAVTSGEFDKALVYWNDYVGRLQEELQQHRLSEPQVQEMGALVEWARSVVLCARAHDQSLLSSLCAARMYAPAVSGNQPQIIQLRL